MLEAMRNCSARIAAVFGLVLIMAVTSALLIFLLPLATATPVAATSGFPLYSWGFNNNGELGLGDTTNRSVPTRVGELNNWVASATSSSGSFAINVNGELFAWGNRWDHQAMGQGGVDPSTETTLMVPTQIGTENNWAQISARATNVLAINDDGELFRWGAGALGSVNAPTQVGTASNWVYTSAGNSEGYAINSDGHLYAWGANNFGQLGQGDTTTRSVPTRVGDRSDWVTVSSGASFAVGITADGALWAWGVGSVGRLGQGDGASRSVPTQVGTAYNWTAVRTTNAAVAAINTDGELWTWGDFVHGQLGRPFTSSTIPGTAPLYSVPGRVGTESNWTSVMGGNNHFLAFNTYGELFAWGNNGSGRLGIGDTTSRFEPTFVLQASIASEAARGGGGHSLMLFAVAPVSELHTLTKNLQKPEGISQLTKSFTFVFEGYSFDGNTADANLLPIIPNRVLILDGSSPSTTADGTTTVTGTKDILEGITFDRAGVFSYLVSEVAGSSNTSLPSVMQYSAAVYEMNVYVRLSSGIGAAAELYVYRITVTPRVVDNDTQTVGERNDELIFTNTYVPYEEPYIPGDSIPTTPTVPGPDDGSDETTPAPGNGTDRQPQTGPQTGDISNPVLHLMHMVLAAAIIAVLCYRMRCSSEGLVKK